MENIFKIHGGKYKTSIALLGVQRYCMTRNLFLCHLPNRMIVPGRGGEDGREAVGMGNGGILNARRVDLAKMV